GPIGRSDIRLTPFTVLIGPNNSGKSFLCALIYSAHAFARGRGSYYRRASDLTTASRTTTPRRTYDKLSTLVQDALNKVEPGPEGRSRLFSKISTQKRAALRDLVRFELEDYAVGVTTELERCLGGRLHELVRENKSGRELRITISD